MGATASAEPTSAIRSSILRRVKRRSSASAEVRTSACTAASAAPARALNPRRQSIEPSPAVSTSIVAARGSRASVCTTLAPPPSATTSAATAETAVSAAARGAEALSWELPKHSHPACPARQRRPCATVKEVNTSASTAPAARAGVAIATAATASSAAAWRPIDSRSFAAAAPTSTKASVSRSPVPITPIQCSPRAERSMLRLAGQSGEHSTASRALG